MTVVRTPDPLDLELAALGGPQGAAPRKSAAALLAAAATATAASASKAATAGTALLAAKLAAALLLATSFGVVVDLSPAPTPAAVGQVLVGPARPAPPAARFGVGSPDASSVLPAVLEPAPLPEVRPLLLPLAPAPLEAPAGALTILASSAAPVLPAVAGPVVAPPAPGDSPASLLPEPDELLARSDVDRLELPDLSRSRTRLRLAAQGTAWRADTSGGLGPGLALGIHHEGRPEGVVAPYLGATLDTAVLPPPAGHRGAAPQVDVGAAGRGGAALRWSRAGVDLGWTGGVRVLPPVAWLERDRVVVMPVTGPEVGVVLGRADKGRFFASLQLQGGLIDSGGDLRFVPRAAISLGADLPVSRRL